MTWSRVRSRAIAAAAGVKAAGVRFYAFVETIFSERPNFGSASRTVAIATAATVCSCLVFYVRAHRDFPSADVLTALAKLLAAGIAPYGANQVKQLLGFGPPAPADPPPASSPQ